ncbi:MAG: hypothetical protein KGI41_01860 [Patescibacteria group bacterium]|nr:hypothetical protein [Patescibacteria group bacterium]MDE1965967.1 hypothetical protein [Patescibacteria group bacterium]
MKPKNSSLKAGAALAAIALSAALLSACATGVNKYETVQDALRAPLGTDFHIVRYPGGLPGVKDSAPANWSPLQYRQLQYLWAYGCVDQLKPQIAGMGPKAIGKEAGVYGAGLSGGTTLGILPFHPGNLLFKYTLEGLAYGAGDGAAYGYDQHDKAVKYKSGYCMAVQTYFAQARDGALDGIGIIPNIDAVDGNAITPPKGEDVSPTEQESEAVKERAGHPPTPPLP